MNEKQKVVLVTGSSRGIGKGIALEMARQGYTVVVHGSTESARLRSTYEEVKKLSPASICVVAELSNSAAIREMFASSAAPSVASMPWSTTPPRRTRARFWS